MLTEIIGALTGGFGTKLLDTVKDYIPASMSDAEKKEFELRLLDAAHRHEIELMSAAQSADVEFNARIKDLEGTASDLAKIPMLGPLMLFLRGCQRPAFGLFTLLMDYLVFSGTWIIPQDSRLESAFFAINFLVLGFLFGERAVRNVIPLFERYMGRENT